MSLSLPRQRFRTQSEPLGGSVRQSASGEAAAGDTPAAPPAAKRDPEDDAVAAANRRELAKAEAAFAKSIGVAPAVTAQVLASRSRPAPTLPPAAQEAAERAFAKRIDRDADGTVTVAELQSYDRDESQLRGVSLVTVLGAERRVIADSPALSAYQQSLARSIVRSGGSGTQEDIDATLPTVSKLPIRVLEAMKRAGITVVVCRGSVANYLPDWSAKQPRGHARDSGWDHLPGAVNGKEVVIATIDGGEVVPKLPGARILPPTGHGHGSYNVALHEIGHALNSHFASLYPEDARTKDLCAAMTSDEVVPPALESGKDVSSAVADGGEANRPDYDVDAMSSWSRSFLNARKDDWDRELPYYQQEGKGPGAGGDETFAESFARYYGGDSTLAWHWPKLYAFWDNNPFANSKIREGAAARFKGCAKAPAVPRVPDEAADMPPPSAKAVSDHSAAAVGEVATQLIPTSQAAVTTASPGSAPIVAPSRTASGASVSDSAESTAVSAAGAPLIGMPSLATPTIAAPTSQPPIDTKPTTLSTPTTAAPSADLPHVPTSPDTVVKPLVRAITPRSAPEVKRVPPGRGLPYSDAIEPRRYQIPWATELLSA